MQISTATLRYLEGIAPMNLQLVIMGKDPFPSDAVGIPFCKPTWDQQLSENCSGRYVLLSLGFDPATIPTQYATPIHLFEKLREFGVVFLNVSYVYVGNTLSKKKHLAYLQDAYLKNKAVLDSAPVVICCGEASKLRWIIPINQDHYHCVIHPDIRNKVNPDRYDRWMSWWGNDVLYERLVLTIPSRERT